MKKITVLAALLLTIISSSVLAEDKIIVVRVSTIEKCDFNKTIVTIRNTMPGYQDSYYCVAKK